MWTSGHKEFVIYILLGKYYKTSNKVALNPGINCKKLGCYCVDKSLSSFSTGSGILNV